MFGWFGQRERVPFYHSDLEERIEGRRSYLRMALCSWSSSSCCGWRILNLLSLYLTSRSWCDSRVSSTLLGFLARSQLPPSFFLSHTVCFAQFNRELLRLAHCVERPLLTLIGVDNCIVLLLSGKYKIKKKEPNELPIQLHFFGDSLPRVILLFLSGDTKHDWRGMKWFTWGWCENGK